MIKIDTNFSQSSINFGFGNKTVSQIMRNIRNFEINKNEKTSLKTKASF